jgi:hypothetical protein
MVILYYVKRARGSVYQSFFRAIKFLSEQVTGGTNDRREH